MLHARQSWPSPTSPTSGGEVVAFPAPAPSPPREFGRAVAKPPFSLVVDLSGEEMGWRWCRGAATLALLCATALFLAPGFERRAAAASAEPTVTPNMPLSNFAPSPASAAPAAPPVAPPEPRGISAGEKDGLKRVVGDISGGLYWSLRDAGASPELSADYLKAIADHTDVGEIAPFDRFEFVTDTSSGQLVYAALDRFQGDDVEVLRFSSGGRTGWFSADSLRPSSTGFMAPVAGRITSGFGNRVHPILRFTRFHSGIDFGARWGSPVVAAADGQVVAAGYAGGYGRQVRVAHGGGIVTTYSHMSQIAAAPGTPVRQGQVIGFVGSSGLSTGPHLHFEVRLGGKPVNPLTAHMVERPALDARALAGFKARLKQIKAIPTHKI